MKKARLLSVQDTIWHFYECAEVGDIENMCSYFETLKIHYQMRGSLIKMLRNPDTKRKEGEHD
jgi:hypothetical protein